MPKPPTDARRIESFLAKYTPELVRAAKATRTRLRKHIPGGSEMIYDNYNFLVFGYSPSERASDAVLSLALAPKWVTLCFLKGAELPDPKKLLSGSGSTVRSLRLLRGPAHLEERDVLSLVRLAIASADPPFPKGTIRTVIKSVSARQRPRRPKT